MNTHPHPLGSRARVFLLGLIACCATVGLAVAAPVADSDQPRERDHGDHPQTDPPGDDAPGSAGANRGFVIGVEAGGGLLWHDRLLDQPGEGMGGLTLGYDLGALRLEMEILGRATAEGGHGSDRAGLGHGFGRGRAGSGGFDALLGGLGGGIGGVETETGQLFLNLYYDFETGSRVTPWIGVGGGWATTEVEYEVRTPGLPFPFPGDEIGFPFSSRALEFEGSDSVPGVQALMGADVRLTRRLSLGVKVRWSHFGRATFEGSGTSFGGLADLLGGAISTGTAEDPGPDEVAEVLNEMIGGLFVGAAHPFSIDLSGVGATLTLSYRF